MSSNRYTHEQIVETSKNVKSMSGLLKGLGLRPTGGNYLHMKRKLQQLNVDTSHWTGQAWNREQRLKDWSSYTKCVCIKKHLLKIRSHKCESCQLTDWNGDQIPIELHHKDGDRTNNCLENLQLLCPNCHAMTDNWRRSK